MVSIYEPAQASHLMVAVSEQDVFVTMTGHPLVLLLLFFQRPSTQQLVLSVLANLQQCVRVGLAYESLYWLVYNSVTLIYNVARRLMSRGIMDEVYVAYIVHMGYRSIILLSVYAFAVISCLIV